MQVDIVDTQGSTALHHAVAASRLLPPLADSSVSLLLAAGAKAVQDKHGRSPLHAAVTTRFVNPALVTLLVQQAGCDPAAQDKHGCSATDLALAAGCSAAVLAAMGVSDDSTALVPKQPYTGSKLRYLRAVAAAAKQQPDAGAEADWCPVSPLVSNTDYAQELFQAVLHAAQHGNVRALQAAIRRATGFDLTQAVGYGQRGIYHLLCSRMPGGLHATATDMRPLMKAALQLNVPLWQRDAWGALPLHVAMSLCATESTGDSAQQTMELATIAQKTVSTSYSLRLAWLGTMVLTAPHGWHKQPYPGIGCT